MLCGKENVDVLDWLTLVDYGPKHADYLRRRQPGTGQWLLDSQEYQNWIEEPQTILSCPGIPGDGKTTLASAIINDLYNKFHDDTNVRIAYLYFSLQHKHEQWIEDLLSSLLKQLAQSLPAPPEKVQRLHDRHLQKRTRPSLDQISDALVSVSAMYSRVFIVIDALDKCQTLDDCRSEFAAQVRELQVKSRVNTLVISGGHCRIFRLAHIC